jgi:putative flippase GtrA
MAKMSKLLKHTLIKYLITGVGNTLVGLSIIYFFLYVLGWKSAPANLVGYGVGMVFSFAVNKRWTFGDTGSHVLAFIRFAVVLCVAYLANLVTVLELEQALHVNKYLAQAAGVPPYTLVGYLGCRFYAFNNHSPGVYRTDQAQGKGL